MSANTDTAPSAILVDGYHRFDPRKYTPDVQSAIRKGRKLVHAMQSYLPEPKSTAIVELGCGNGGFLAGLRSEGYSNVRGCDLCQPLVDYAVENGFGDIRCANVLDYLDTIAEPVDRIFMFDVIEHLDVQQVIALLHKVHKALKPGGLFVGTTPNGQCPFAAYYLIGDLTHRQIFTHKTLGMLVEGAGFSRFDTRSSYVPGRLTGLVDRILKKLAYAYYGPQHFFFFFHWPKHITANFVFCATK